MTDTLVDKAELKDLVADALDVMPEALTDEALFVEDLAVDSLVALEMAVTLERKYQVKISEEEIVTVKTLPDVYAMLVRKLGGE
jgi:acyl carrier protein